MKLNDIFKEIKNIKTFFIREKVYPLALEIGDNYIVLSRKKLLIQ